MVYFDIYLYQDQDEIRLDHPYYKSFELIYQSIPGSTVEMQTEGIRKAFLRKGKWSPIVFRIGNQFWIPASKTPPILSPKEQTLCHE